MIPKLIHYVWLSGEPYPEAVRRCIDSWHRHMPDWEFVLWDSARIQPLLTGSPWLTECLEARQWAFATDYIRLYAISHYGGIYLDTDCLVYRSLEPLLSQQAFIGREWSIHNEGFTTHQYLTAHCFGAVSHHPFVTQCLDYYSGRHFRLSGSDTLPPALRFDQRILPFILTQLARPLGYDPSPYSSEQQIGAGVHIYPSSFFDPYRPSSVTYCQHLCLGGWRLSSAQGGGHITLGYRLRYRAEEFIIWLLDKFGLVVFRKRH